MKQVISLGIVLGRTDFGEADRILTVITPDQGKLRLIAKGVRRAKSKMAGGVELFSISQITYIPGRGEIGTLVSARLKDHYGKIVQDIERTMYGYEVLKVVSKSTEDEVGCEYFDLVATVLASLDNFDLPIEYTALWFDIRLLGLTGHLPNLRTDAQGKRLEQSKKYGLVPQDMVFVEQQDGQYEADHIKLLRLASSIEAPVTLLQVNGTDRVIGQCSSLARQMRQFFISA